LAYLEVTNLGFQLRNTRELLVFIQNELLNVLDFSVEDGKIILFSASKVDVSKRAPLIYIEL